MTRRTGHAEAEDGTVIGYTAVGEGEPLVLVHSAAADARQWDRLVPLLASTFTTVALDRRGRGRSGRQRPGHSLETEYGDIAAVARSLGRPVHLLGHSSGARYALHAALRVPDLAGLVLYEPPVPQPVPDAVLERVADLQAAGDRVGIMRTFLVDFLGTDEEVFAWIRERPIWPLMVDNALTLPAELRADRHYRFDAELVAGLDVPTLLLLGELSQAELGGTIRSIAAALPRAETVILPGQGHGAMFDAPELLAREVRRFLVRLGR